MCQFHLSIRTLARASGRRRAFNYADAVRRCFVIKTLSLHNHLSPPVLRDIRIEVEASVSSHCSSSYLFALLRTSGTSSHFFALLSFILFQSPTIMRFSTLIAFMLPLSALGRPIQSDIDSATKVFVDGFNLARSTLANMALTATLRVKTRQTGLEPPALDRLAAINRIERILDDFIPKTLPDTPGCVDPPH